MVQHGVVREGSRSGSVPGTQVRDGRCCVPLYGPTVSASTDQWLVWDSGARPHAPPTHVPGVRGWWRNERKESE